MDGLCAIHCQWSRLNRPVYEHTWIISLSHSLSLRFITNPMSAIVHPLQSNASNIDADITTLFIE